MEDSGSRQRNAALMRYTAVLFVQTQRASIHLIARPIAPTDTNLIAGMKLYQTNCASCHGGIDRPKGIFADALYPHAPQFVEDAPDMPESQNFYIIEHGIRWSGMPAWKQVLSNQEAWQLTTFLSHMDKLPPRVSVAWKTSATQP